MMRTSIIKSILVLTLALPVLAVPVNKPIENHPSTVNSVVSDAQAMQSLSEPTFQPQAKLAYKVVEKPPEAPKQAPAPVAGSCDDWIAQAGITEVAAAKELLRRESGCNPNAVNRSSGACGLAQELPCGKSGCKLGDGACQMKWMQKYISDRYGSWANAIAHHDRMNWY